MSEPTYPRFGFPKTTETTIEDWVPIDGQWHSLVYVHHPHGVATDLYVDGKLVPASGEQEPINGFRRWDRALSQAQVERLAEAGPTGAGGMSARLSLALRRLRHPRPFAELHHVACPLVRPRCPCLWGWRP